MVCLGKIGNIQLGDCGGGNSKDIKVSVKSTSITNMNNSLKSLQSQETNTTLNQQQNIAVIGNCCQPLKIAQDLKATVIDTSKMSVSFKSQMANQLSKDVDKAMEEAEKTVNDLLKNEAGGKLRAAVNTTLTKMNSQNKVANIISEKVTNTIANQGQNIYINCGSGDIKTPPPPDSANMPDTGCYITQDFIFSQVTNNVMEAVFNSISNEPEVEAVLNEIAKETQEKVITTEEPKLEVVKKFLGIPYKIAAGIGGLLSLIVLVLLIFTIIG